MIMLVMMMMTMMMMMMMGCNTVDFCNKPFYSQTSILTSSPPPSAVTVPSPSFSLALETR